MYLTSTSFRRTKIQIMTTNSWDVFGDVAFITIVAVSQHLAKNHSQSREASYPPTAQTTPQFSPPQV
jgi:hypothetical protein